MCSCCGSAAGGNGVNNNYCIATSSAIAFSTACAAAFTTASTAVSSASDPYSSGPADGGAGSGILLIFPPFPKSGSSPFFGYPFMRPF